jgi:adenine-specific DNA-methyltransferase
MEKLKMHSPDFTQENIAKLAGLFPNCVTEAKSEDGTVKRAIDFDQLRQELATAIVEGPQERYQLNWPGKREALLTANAPIAKTLRPCREESVDFDTTQNLFIEGDNLDALKLLQETYLNKVKMIYIDPPYNTGKDFLYEDDFADDAEAYLVRSNQKDEAGNRLMANTEANGRFHSDWLTMLYSRLKLARNLLSDDGVIFFSIDDNEATNLRKICDEIFGEHNFVAAIANTNNPKGRSDDKFIATAHEYIFVVAKNINELNLGGFEAEENITKRYNKTDNTGRRYREMDLRKTGDADRREDRPQMFYYFYYSPKNETVRVSKVKDGSAGETEIIPIREDNVEGRWRWGFDTAKIRLADLIVRFMPNREIWGIFEKDYLDDRPLVKSTSSWSFKDVNSERGSEQFIELGFKKEVFPRPKPLGTLDRVLRLGSKPGSDDLVLDFFCGSATTAHAVMNLNAEDGGMRRHIMVQLPEFCDENSEAFKAGYKTIAEIGKERIRRAGKKIKAENPLTASDLDIGFRVLKIDSSNMKDVYYAPDAVKQGDLLAQVNNIREDRTPEDLLFQVLLDWGVDLALPITKEVIAGKNVFFVDGNALAAYFEMGINEEFVKSLAARHPLRAVFRDSGFGSDSVKINIEQIFKLISPTTEVKSI